MAAGLAQLIDDSHRFDDEGAGFIDPVADFEAYAALAPEQESPAPEVAPPAEAANDEIDEVESHFKSLQGLRLDNEVLRQENHRLWERNDELKRRFGQATEDADLGALLVAAPDLLQEALEPTRWAIAGLLPRCNVSGLSGPPGVAKSLLAQQMATMIAAGHDFLGRDVERGPALYLTVEDDRNELHKRQRNINRVLGIGADEIDQLYLMSAKGRDMLLVHVENNLLRRTANFCALDSMIGKLGLHFLALDLLPDLWNGNEIIRVQVNAFVKHHLAYLADKHQCAILCLYHPSKAGQNDGTGSSGSTAWDGSFRSRMYLTRPDRDSEVRKLSLAKANYAALGEMFLEYSDGALVESDFVPQGVNVDRGLSDNQVTAMKLLGKLANFVSGSDYRVLRVDWRFECKQAGINENTFKKLPAALEKRGLIRLDGTAVELTDAGEKLVNSMLSAGSTGGQ